MPGAVAASAAALLLQLAGLAAGAPTAAAAAAAPAEPAKPNVLLMVRPARPSLCPLLEPGRRFRVLQSPRPLPAPLLTVGALLRNSCATTCARGCPSVSLAP